MKRSAFTIIELLISMSIMALLFGIGGAKYVSFNQSQTLKQAAQKLRNELRVVANRAITGEKMTCLGLDGYWVTFINTQYVLRVACSDGNSQAFNTIRLPTGVTVNSVPSAVFFKVLGQGVSSAVTITLSGFGKTEIVMVNISGEIQ